MEQEKALNALAGTMALLSNASSSRMVAELLTRATSTPGAYIFSELLYHPKVQSLSSDPQYQSHLKHLEIFSHGSYQDYISKTESLPPLNEAQTLKLRQLTLLTLARDRSALAYDNLQLALSLTSSRDLEEIVISAVYANMVAATLDPARQMVCITSVSPLRDVKPSYLARVQAGLEEWSNRCVTTLQKLEEEAAAIKSGAAMRVAEAQRQEVEVDSLVEAEKMGLSGGGSGGGSSQSAGGRAGSHSHGHGRKSKRSAVLGAQEEDEISMDVDDDDDGGEKKRGRRRLVQG